MRLFLIILFFSITYTGFSQKFGHINSAEVLSKVPEIAKADSLLLKLQDTLVRAGEIMVKSFQAKVAAYQAEVDKGSLAPVAAKKKEEDLGKEQQSLQDYQNQVKQSLMIRREELYKPILDRVDALVKKIGKDNKYTMIFDSSQPGYLYLSESEDLSAVILKELGLSKP